MNNIGKTKHLMVLAITAFIISCSTMTKDIKEKRCDDPRQCPEEFWLKNTGSTTIYPHRSTDNRYELSCVLWKKGTVLNRTSSSCVLSDLRDYSRTYYLREFNNVRIAYQNGTILSFEIGAPPANPLRGCKFTVRNFKYLGPFLDSHMFSTQIALGVEKCSYKFRTSTQLPIMHIGNIQ